MIEHRFIRLSCISVPETCSDMFRILIESLFITHGQTNLNTMGNVIIEKRVGDSYPMNNPWLVRGDDWFQGLVRRPRPKLIK